MVSKYSDFLLENKLDLINESIVYLSPNLRKVLRKIPDNQIAKDILDIAGQNIKDDITFIDIDKQDGYLSFTTMKNAVKYISTAFSPDSTYLNIQNTPKVQLADNFYEYSKDNMWFTARNPLRIGRLVTKLFPDKFTDKEKEEFTNKFKAALEVTGERFLLVSGSDIATWYSSSNYFSNQHTLGNSCMKHSSEKLFDIYCKNPEICQMVCLIDDDSMGKPKLKGRAILWRVTDIDLWAPKEGLEVPKFEYFMDRQYAISDAVIEKMRSYAKERGWAYKSYNNHHSYQNVTVNGTDYLLAMRLHLKNEEYKYFPYVDTFRRFDPKSFTLFNDDDKTDHGGQYLLNASDGSYEKIPDPNSEEEMVYCEYYDREIERENAVYTDRFGYLPNDSVVHVTIGANAGYYPEDYDDIVFDDWSEQSLHIDDAVYCGTYGYFIYHRNAIKVVTTISSSGDCDNDENYIHRDDTDSYKRFGDEINLKTTPWYKILHDKYEDWENCVGILNNLLIKDSFGNWILRKFQLTTYKLNNQIGNLMYITNTDAIALDLTIDSSDRRIEDGIMYHYNLYTSNLYEKLEKSLESKINSKQLSFEFDKDFPKQDYKQRLRMLNNLAELFVS